MSEPMPEPPAVPPGAAGVPLDLLAAFERYETAILANDLDALDAAFAPGADTLRGDGAGLLVGHEAIAAFRGTRGGVAPRVIERIEHRALGTDAALLVSVSRYAGGGTGLQTQLWQRIDGEWLITAAHVTPRAHALDRTVWRTVGDPLWQGAWEGPLAGSTVAVKDLFAIKGYRIGAGNPAYLDSARAETTTAPAVSDLLRGGASLRGIARTDEFAYSIAGENVHYGTPPNGALPGALPGGSSSGPASAVATGQADIGLATDTAGSVRVPASYQGLWGLRTTHGLVPRQGLLPLAQSFDAVGWLTRDGETLQRVADWCLSYDGSESTESVAAETAPARGGVAEAAPGHGAAAETASGHGAAAETASGRGGAAETPGRGRAAETAPARGRWGESGIDLPWRFAVPAEALAAAEPATRAAFEAMLDALTTAFDGGATPDRGTGLAPEIERVAFGALDEYFVPFRTVQAAEAWRNNGEWLRAHPGSVGPAVADRFSAAASVTAADEAAARAGLAPLRERVRALVRDAVLILPTVPGPAPARGLAGDAIDAVRVTTLRMTTPAAVAGLPALSVPLLTVPSALGPAPVGVCLISREGTDIALVRLARRLSAALKESPA